MDEDLGPIYRAEVKKKRLVIVIQLYNPKAGEIETEDSLGICPIILACFLSSGSVGDLGTTTKTVECT